MIGKIKKVKDILGNYTYPITVWQAVYVDNNMTLDKKFSTLSAVTTSGSYNDLKDKPDIPIPPTMLGQLIDDSMHRFVTDEEKNAWNNKSGINYDYNNLINKPTIPTLLSQLSDDSMHRFVTDDEKNIWNSNKGTTNVATTSVNGLMSSDDKIKLDGLSNYIHPDVHSASMIAQDANNRFVTDIEKIAWNAKSNFDGDYNSLNNKPIIPIPPTLLSQLTDDATHRFVTDIEKSVWNNKASTNIATTLVNGLMSSDDKIKLDGLSNYIHPISHPASMINQDANSRFVTDVEKSNWNDKYTKAEIDNKFSTQATNMDWKESVDTYADINIKYPSPNDGWTVNVKDTDITYRFNGLIWIPISANSIPLATSSVDGKMSSSDKAKLDDIAAGANNYIHPISHPASIILQDSNNRFVTDAEKTVWNAKSNFNGDYNSLINKPSLAVVALSGSYNDLINKPVTMPANGGNSDMVDGYHASSLLKTGMINTISTMQDGIGSVFNFKDINANGTNDSFMGISFGSNYYEDYVIGKHTGINQSSFEIRDHLKNILLTLDPQTKNLFIGPINTNRVLTTTDSSSFATASHQHVISDITELKTMLDSKAGTAVVTTSANGLMSSIDKTKLDNLNNYTHPSTHSPSIILQDANNRFVTDTQIAAWNNKSNFDGNYSSLSNKPILSLIATSGKYDDLINKPLIIADLTDEGGKLCYKGTLVANSGTSGFDGNYENLTNKPVLSTVSISGSYNDLKDKPVIPILLNQLTDDTTHRFVSDTEKTTWNNKASTNVATTSANGLMSKTDKSKLDGISPGANNYVHPIGDGNLHVPANGTTNINKVLKAGATAGSYSWSNVDYSEIVNKPTIPIVSTAGLTGSYTDLINRPSIISDLSDQNGKLYYKGSPVDANNGASLSDFDGSYSSLKDAPVLSNAAMSGSYNDLKDKPTIPTALSQLTSDVNNRLVTDTEKTNWNAKASTNTATTLVNGLMSSSDKTKLDGLINYVHPATHSANIIMQDANNRFVTDSQIDAWNNKSNFDGNYNNLSNKPTIPTLLNQLNDDTTHRLVSDTEKTNWDAKASTDIVTSSVNGLMSSSDKSKLDGIAANANNYVHPASHTPSIISQDSNNRFVTDAEKSIWNAKASTSIVTTSTNGLMSSSDKSKLDGIASNANNYVHPLGDGNLHIPANGIANANKVLKAGAAAGSYSWGNVDYSEILNKPIFATVASSGSYTDLSNRPNIPTALSQLTDGSSYRLVTDAEKTTWNAKANTSAATTSVNGLMSSSDKSKLDGIAANANNYTHPSTHSPSIIVQDSNNRFVTDSEKTTWNDKYTKAEIDNKFSAQATNMDWKKSVETYTDIATTYPTPNDGWTVNVKDTDITYRYNGSIWIAISANSIPLATNSVDGKMSAADKAKLDGIAEGATNYAHPETHAASMIVQDSNSRFVTDSEKSTWNAKSNFDGNYNSLSNKPTLATIATSGNYTDLLNKPTIPIALSQLTSDANNQLVSDAEKAAWNAKAGTSIATTSANGLMSSTDKTKLDGVAANANNYTHPATHNPSIILQDANNRFVTDTEKTAWNAKASTAIVTTSANGLMSNTDKTKLDGLSNYVHPLGDGNLHIPANGTTNANKILKAGATAGNYSWSNVDYSEILNKPTLAAVASSGSYIDLKDKPAIPTALNQLSDDITHRFVTDSEKSTWNNKASTDTATTLTSGLMSNTDKTKLDSLTNYIHPATHNPSIILQDANNRFVTDAEKSNWNAKSTFDGNYNNLTNKPTIPTLLSQLSDDSTHRLVTDTEKSTWNAKASTDIVTITANGLMSSTDKTKLDGVAANANNYIHPASHVPSIITQDSNNRFVTDAEKSSWNAKASTSLATISVNGLMSSTDKTKLDGLSNYTHPTGDGNLHVPANGTTNANKVLKAGVSAGTYTWGSIDYSEVLNKPTISTALSQLTDDATHRLVTDTEKSTWNSKLATKADIESVLTGVITTHTHSTGTPTVHASTHITGGDDIIPNAVANGNAGLMSGSDKAKLDNMSSFDGNYNSLSNKPTIPTSLSQLTDDANHRFVTDAEKAAWGSSSSPSIATPTTDGLMSMNDKIALESLKTDVSKIKAAAGYELNYFVEDDPIAVNVGDKKFEVLTGIEYVWNGTTWIGLNTYM